MGNQCGRSWQCSFDEYKGKADLRSLVDTLGQEKSCRSTVSDWTTFSVKPKLVFRIIKFLVTLV